jgi:hypothetical protein
MSRHEYAGERGVFAGEWSGGGKSASWSLPNLSPLHKWREEMGCVVLYCTYTYMYRDQQSENSNYFYYNAKNGIVA